MWEMSDSLSGITLVFEDYKNGFNWLDLHFCSLYSNKNYIFYFTAVKLITYINKTFQPKKRMIVGILCEQEVRRKEVTPINRIKMTFSFSFFILKTWGYKKYFYDVSFTIVLLFRKGKNARKSTSQRLYLPEPGNSRHRW